jgi:hypothetical protein
LASNQINNELQEVQIFDLEDSDQSTITVKSPIKSSNMFDTILHLPPIITHQMSEFTNKMLAEISTFPETHNMLSNGMFVLLLN